MARVSVIIPTYNRLPKVKDAIESVLKQTYRDFELWVTDDGSTDGTGEALRTFGNRIKYVYQDNSGISAARNLGMRVSRGKYVAFLDSDDLWEPRKLEIQVGYMEANPQFPLCYTDEVWIRREIRVNPKKRHAKYSGWIFEKCLPLCIISPSSALMKRNLFEEMGGFDETFPVCEDYDFWLRVTCHYPVLFIDKKLIIKRGGHPDQLSIRSWGNDRYRVMALEKLLRSENLKAEDKRMASGELVRKCHILSRGFYKRGKREEGRRYEELAKRYGA
ncbi:MAG: glycosyltransferase [Syntrophobacterales bacterium]|nr:MAG: glycosyltransferase [Syntrophobacterales bacterium]